MGVDGKKIKSGRYNFDRLCSFHVKSQLVCMGKRNASVSKNIREFFCPITYTRLPAFVTYLRNAVSSRRREGSIGPTGCTGDHFHENRPLGDPQRGGVNRDRRVERSSLSSTVLLQPFLTSFPSINSGQMIEGII